MAFSYRISILNLIEISSSRPSHNSPHLPLRANAQLSPISAIASDRIVASAFRIDKRRSGIASYRGLVRDKECWWPNHEISTSMTGPSTRPSSYCTSNESWLTSARQGRARLAATFLGRNMCYLFLCIHWARPVLCQKMVLLRVFRKMTANERFSSDVENEVAFRGWNFVSSQFCIPIDRLRSDSYYIHAWSSSKSTAALAFNMHSNVHRVSHSLYLF